jgi:hypothetical protein
MDLSILNGEQSTQGDTMKRMILGSGLALGLFATGLAMADDKAATIANAESAAPASVTADATIKTPDGKVLREGSNGYTCYPQQAVLGPMCNEAVWDGLISAMMNKADYAPDKFSVSYMLAGEGTALGVSNSDPYASDPKMSDDWVKEGPHLMIVVPDINRSQRPRVRDVERHPVRTHHGQDRTRRVII